MATKSTSRRSSPPKRTVQTRRARTNLQRESMSDDPNPAEMQQRLGNRKTQAWLAEQGSGQPVQAKLTVGEPNDKYEQEADRVADTVMRMPEPGIPEGEIVQAKPLVQRQSDDEEMQKQPMEEEEELVQTKPLVNRQIASRATPIQPKEVRPQTPQVTPAVATNVNTPKNGGSPLREPTRAFFEPRFGEDFSQVRVHKDAKATESARAINARAYTIGRDVVFGAGEYSSETGEGKKLLAHELTHVVQQKGVGTRIQRYEAGEHAQLGETQAEMKASFAPTSYTVKKGETLDVIAKKFGITVTELKDANKTKLKKWRAKSGSGRMIEGFNAGEIVSIPQQLNTLAKSAIKDKSAKFTVNGVVLDYGVGIAMADLFENPEQMAKASSPKELKELATLINRERSGGKAVSTQEWEKATSGRYLKLAEKNEAHFAPPSATLVTPSKAGAASPNHKKAWETHHDAALLTSQGGNKDKALSTNAFADHFLTDAFAAGHLVNKRDVMEKFKSQLKTTGKGKDKDFTKKSKKFFDAVAKDAFTGSVKSEFSKFETVEFKGVIFRPNINSESRFSTLLQGIHMEEPDLLANAVAKGVHDKLNTIPGGLPVENAKGDSWNLSGDGTLNAKTKEIARKAVAESQLNVISVYNLTGPLNYPVLHKKVWDYTPKPNTAGTKQLMDVVQKGTDVSSADLKKAVVKLIQDNYKLIIEELVKRNKLKKA